MAAVESDASHRALISTSDDDFATSAERFVTDGLGWGEHVLCVLGPASTDTLRGALGDRADAVEFWSPAKCYDHPPSALANYLQHLATHRTDECGIRVLGELDLSRYSSAEAQEWERYEAAVNAVFAGQPVSFLCHYDARLHTADQLRQVLRTHSQLWTAELVVDSDEYREPAESFAALQPADLDDLGEPRATWLIDPSTLAQIRNWTRVVCHHAGLDADRCDDAVLAVHEIAENTIAHGGGGGYLRQYVSGPDVIFDIANLSGRIGIVLGGYEPADATALRGRGLWMAQQLSDRVEICGNTVRLRFSSATAATRRVDFAGQDTEQR